MAPLSLFFVIPDLPIGLGPRTPLHQHRGSEEDPVDGIFTLGAPGQRGLGDPLDDLKALPAMITTQFRFSRLIFVGRHTSSPRTMNNHLRFPPRLSREPRIGDKVDNLL